MESVPSVPLRKRRGAALHKTWVYPGLYCDCECTNPLYVDVLHPVRVLSLNDDGMTCQVVFVSWNDSQPETEPLALLSPLSPAVPDAAYACGDRVLFRCWDRHVSGHPNLDGVAGRDEGVWIRGNIETFTDDGDAVVRHTNWKKGTTTTCTDVRHLRPDISKQMFDQASRHKHVDETILPIGPSFVQTSLAIHRPETKSYLLYFRLETGAIATVEVCINSQDETIK